MASRGGLKRKRRMVFVQSHGEKRASRGRRGGRAAISLVVEGSGWQKTKRGWTEGVWPSFGGRQGGEYTEQRIIQLIVGIFRVCTVAHDIAEWPRRRRISGPDERASGSASTCSTAKLVWGHARREGS